MLGFIIETDMELKIFNSFYNCNEKEFPKIYVEMGVDGDTGETVFCGHDLLEQKFLEEICGYNLRRI